MTYLSIIEKFKILFNSLMDYEFILVISLIMLFITFFYILRILSIRKYILYMIISFVFVFGISIISNYEVLSNTFDNFTTIIFENIYFPSIYVYIGVLFITFVAFVISNFNVMFKRIYKIINSIMFVLNNILFVIILNIIAKNRIDIFSVSSLYTNTSLVAILELSMGLFIIWVLSLFVIYITNVICDRVGTKKVYNPEYNVDAVYNSILEVNNIVEEIDDRCQTDEIFVMTNDIDNSSENIVIMENEKDINVVSAEVEYSKIENSNTNENIVIEDNSFSEETLNIDMQLEEKEENIITFNDILNGCVPVTYYNNNVKEEEYILYDPQNEYEANYNKIKDMCVDVETISMSEFENKELLYIDVEKENNRNILLDNTSGDVLSVEKLTLLEKERLSEERLVTNTISLNDLINDVDNEEKKDVIVENKIDNVYNVEYTLEDYKKFGKMLSDIKNRSNGTNINIDDAVALGLINNYSIDDCIKFKDLIESNLN